MEGAKQQLQTRARLARAGQPATKAPILQYSFEERNGLLDFVIANQHLACSFKSFMTRKI
jgi:hypothetical protein